jgi:effector-binding domain-containing protein
MTVTVQVAMTTQLQNEPKIVERPEQLYVAIRRSITMATFGEIIDGLSRVFAWLAARGIDPAGPPFFKYDIIDMERQLVVEAGVPVDTEMSDDGEIVAAVLPAGRYVTVTHVGHPDELLGVTASLLAWADEHDLRWDVADGPEGQRWGCRLEVMKTNPDDEPDMTRWETELVFRLAD